MPVEKRLMYVGAHPDDESFGPGGTLAHYVLVGARVAYACTTRGEVGSVDPEHLLGYASIGDMRWAELTNAAKELGLAEVLHLGYRDSGMAGSPDNDHPDALTAAPLEAVTARVVQALRAFRPQVIITFDPIGGYRHPDHIATHRATVQAFGLAGNATYAPELGAPYTPQKLYFSVFPKQLLKMAVRLMPLFRQDPHHFGRNKDIDVTQLMDEFPIHTRLKIEGAALARRQAASLCHKSQLGSGPPQNGVMQFIMRLWGTTDTYMRAYPTVPEGARVSETDLFADVNVD